jgi:flagellar protein FlbD
MIVLTRLHGEPIVINADQIEFIEPTPDTIISTVAGRRFMVKETVEEVIGKVIEYRRRCLPERREPEDDMSAPISPPV